MNNPETPPTLGTRHGTNSNKAKNTTQKTKKMSKVNTNKNISLKNSLYRQLFICMTGIFFFQDLYIMLVYPHVSCMNTMNYDDIGCNPFSLFLCTKGNFAN